MKPANTTMGILTCMAGVACAASAATEPPDPRLRTVPYDPAGVVTVPVKRGTVTLVVLGADEAISEVASGLGADCAKSDASWCVAAQAGGRTIFIKPKTAASGSNNLAVVTDRRIHNMRFTVLEDHDPRLPVHRLVVRAPSQPPSALSTEVQRPPPPPFLPVLALPATVSPAQVVAERLQAKPRVLNAQYSLAEGPASEDIVPALVFDDGKFTYLRFPGNREVPAVFHVLGDGSEALVNVRMEDDLLVVDRVSRRLMLRAGNAVVGLWNDAFDPEGAPPSQGTTVPGVQRVLRAAHADSQGALKGGNP